MDTLFGVSMDTWMAIMLTLFLIVTGVVAVLALRNRLFLKLGLRNLPRRRAQTVLIVIGLMLATVIITSALGVGDTISYSLRSGYVQSLGPVDELVGTQSGFSNGATSYFPVGITTQIRQRLAAVPVAGVAPSIVETVAIQDLTTRQTKARMGILGVPVDYPAAFGGITSTDGTPVSLSGLAANHVYLNELAARSLGAHAGDTLVIFFRPCDPAAARSAASTGRPARADQSGAGLQHRRFAHRCQAQRRGGRPIAGAAGRFGTIDQGDDAAGLAVRPGGAQSGGRPVERLDRRHAQAGLRGPGDAGAACRADSGATRSGGRDPEQPERAGHLHLLQTR